MKKTSRIFAPVFCQLSLCAFLCCAAAGCLPSARVVPFKADAAAVQTGIVFYLPKHLLEATITYTEFEKKVWHADVLGNAVKKDGQGRAVQPTVTQYAAVVEPVKVRLKTIPDYRMGFLLDPESLRGFFFDTKLAVETTADSRLKTINCSTDDKTADVAAGLAKTAFQLAKAAAVAGEKAVEIKKIRDIEVVRLIDPASLAFEKKGDMYEAAYADMPEIRQVLPPGTTPDAVKIIFRGDTDLGALSKTAASDMQFEGGPLAELRGMPYRVARPVSITVTADNFEQKTRRVLYSDVLSFVQAGGLACVPVQGRRFSSAASGLELYDAEGSLKKYSFSGTSPAENLAKAAADMSADAAKQMKELATLEQEVQLDQLKTRKQILENRKDISDLDPGSLTSRTERLKQMKALIDAELALEKTKDKGEENQ
jgi:hypothetical protein